MRLKRNLHSPSCSCLAPRPRTLLRAPHRTAMAERTVTTETWIEARPRCSSPPTQRPIWPCSPPLLLLVFVVVWCCRCFEWVRDVGAKSAPLAPLSSLRLHIPAAATLHANSRQQQHSRTQHTHTKHSHTTHTANMFEARLKQGQRTHSDWDSCDQAGAIALCALSVCGA